MALGSFQVATLLDSALPRDRVISVLHFNIRQADPLASTDWDALSRDLLAIWRSNWGRPDTTQEISVTAYDLDDPKPRSPKSVQRTGTGLAPAATCPREVAMCLSFYSGSNRPRNRGRIYLSPAARGLTGLGARPTTQQMNDALAMAAAFSGLGGANVDWCVRSVADNQFKKVSHAYVDDEWDVQRRRGLKAANRVAASQSG